MILLWLTRARPRLTEEGSKRYRDATAVLVKLLLRARVTCARHRKTWRHSIVLHRRIVTKPPPRELARQVDGGERRCEDVRPARWHSPSGYIRGSWENSRECEEEEKKRIDNEGSTTVLVSRQASMVAWLASMQRQDLGWSWQGLDLDGHCWCSDCSSHSTFKDVERQEHRLTTNQPPSRAKNLLPRQQARTVAC